MSPSVVQDPDETFEVAPGHGARWERSLENAAETGRVRGQVVDVDAPPPPKVTEYQLVLRRCGGGGQVNDPTASDVPRLVTDPGSDGQCCAASAWDQAGAPDPATTEPMTESAPDVLTQIRHHYLGALAKGRTDNHNHRSALAIQARRLIRRFTRYED